MTDKSPLSDEDRQRHADRLTEDQLKLTPKVENPRIYMLGGQSGAGKTAITERIGSELSSANLRPVVVDADRVRPTIPYVKAEIDKGNLELPAPAYFDSGTIAFMMVDRASTENRNIIYDGTLSNAKYASQTADLMKERGYRVEVHTMAVSPELSHARTYSRRELQIIDSPSGYGRGVDDSFHDNAVKGLVETIGKLQEAGKVDSITLYDRTGQSIGSIERDGDTWKPDRDMAAALSQVHKNPDDVSRAEAAVTWSRAADMMIARNADPADLAKVVAFRDGALAREAGEMPTPTSRANMYDKVVSLPPHRAAEEIEKYLPAAAKEAADRLQKVEREGARPDVVGAARADVTLTTHERGPAYQAKLLEQLGVRKVEARMSMDQTPLERVREVGAAVSTQLKSIPNERLQIAMRTLDAGMKTPAPDRTTSPAKPLEKAPERGR